MKFFDDLNMASWIAESRVKRSKDGELVATITVHVPFNAGIKLRHGAKPTEILQACPERVRETYDVMARPGGAYSSEMIDIARGQTVEFRLLPEAKKADLSLPGVNIEFQGLIKNPDTSEISMIFAVKTTATGDVLLFQKSIGHNVWMKINECQMDIEPRQERKVKAATA